jgi:hypothetical protein
MPMLPQGWPVAGVRVGRSAGMQNSALCLAETASPLMGEGVCADQKKIDSAQCLMKTPPP